MLSRQITQYLLAVSLSFLSITSWSVTEGFEIPDFNYKQVEGGVEISGCVETCPARMEIPESIDGINVVGIGFRAFWMNSVLEEVIISDTVKYIDQSAFWYAGIYSVRLGNNLRSIGASAFMGNKIFGIIIPSSVEEIWGNAFYGNWLNEVHFYGDRPLIYDAFSSNINLRFFYCDGYEGWPGESLPDSRYGSSAYHDRTPVLNDDCDVSYYPGYLTYDFFDDGIEITGCTYGYCGDGNLIIPSEIDGYVVRSIRGDSFPSSSYGTILTSVVLPETLTNIDAGAFKGQHITTLTIPNNVTSVGENAFQYVQLSEVNVGPDFDLSKNYKAFTNNPGMNIDGFNILKFSDEIMIKGCDGECPSDLIIPNQILEATVSVISANAFNDSGIYSVNIPNSISAIGHHSFASNNLTELILPDELLNIPTCAFCLNLLTEVILPNIVTIESSAFGGNQIKNVTIPTSLENFNPSAFINNLHDDNSSVVKFLGHKPNFTHTFSEPNLIIFFCPKAEGWLGENHDENNYQNISQILDEDCDSDGDGITNSFDSSPFLSNQSAQIDESYSFWDIDKNGSVGALTDGLILLRYFFGLRGEGLTSGAIDSNGLRTSAADIEAYIESHMP